MIQSTNQSEIVLYTTIDGKVKIDTVFQNKTIWLTQKKMAELFDVQRPAITKHLNNVFESDELDEKVVSSILEHTTRHGAIEGKTQTQSVKYWKRGWINDVLQNHRHHLWPLGSGNLCLEIQRDPIMSTMNHVAVGIRRRVRCILDFETIYIMIFRKMAHWKMDKRQWVVYLLRCSDESLYCGITNNLKNRLITHNSGRGAKYTRSRRPVEFSWCQCCNDEKRCT